MLGFIAGLFIGAGIGFFIAALMAMAKKSDKVEDMEKYAEKLYKEATKADN